MASKTDPHEAVVKSFEQASADHATILQAIELGQAAGCWNLTEASNIKTSTNNVEAYVAQHLGNTERVQAAGVPVPNHTDAGQHFNVMIQSLDRACRRGAYNLVAAGNIAKAAENMTNAVKSAMDYDAEVLAAKKPASSALKEPADNVKPI